MPLKTAKMIEFEKMGGRQMLIDISKVFYDKVYQHEWLKHYFENVPQEHIELQQVEFTQTALGGGKVYIGKAPPEAHQHMFITDELYAERQKLLYEAFKECNASQQLIDRWVKIDDAFFGRIVKDSPTDCVKRYPSDEILDFPNPKK